MSILSRFVLEGREHEMISGPESLTRGNPDFTQVAQKEVSY